jgi:riboflavin synthase
VFTGIIETTSKVINVVNGPAFRRLTISHPWNDVKPGESIAVNGCCLTVAEIYPGRAGFDAITETLSKTNLGLLEEGDSVHMERALRVGDRIDGHFVQGHVDGTAKLTGKTENENEYRLTIESPEHLAKYLSPKGSVTLDGVSLTIASLRGNVFEVALIPTTLALTALGSREIGWPFNIEMDILTKTVVYYLEQSLSK